jgi:hypothetical protein
MRYSIHQCLDNLNVQQWDVLLNQRSLQILYKNQPRHYELVPSKREWGGELIRNLSIVGVFSSKVDPFDVYGGTTYLFYLSSIVGIKLGSRWNRVKSLSSPPCSQMKLWRTMVATTIIFCLYMGYGAIFQRICHFIFNKLKDCPITLQIDEWARLNLSIGVLGSSPLCHSGIWYLSPL